jgi:glycosyltransferase involved in cell wall biosynthesis/tetratricopeptide (TPR) repeat protein
MKTESSAKIRRLRPTIVEVGVEAEAEAGTEAEASAPAASGVCSAAPQPASGEARREDGFSAAFYIAFYNDLRDKGPKDAETHWHTMGKSEGRFGSARQVIDDFAANGTHLPPDFDAELYRLLLSRSIRRRVKTELDAAAHYLAIGRATGLRDKPEDADFFRALYFDDGSSYSRILLAAVRREEADIDQSEAALFARIGIRSTTFLRLFDLSDYICLHAGQGLRNRAHCLHHFADHGIRKLAPIALDHSFDPDFYRATNREIVDLSDLDAYRHWLNTGLDRGEAPNAARFLRKLGLLETGRYPPGFVPAIYAAANPDLADTIVGEWRLLQHCINNGIVEKRPGCQRSRQNVDIFRAAADLQAVDGRLDAARCIYQDVLALEPRHVLGLRHYADCLLRLGEWFNAAALYEKTLRSNLSTTWTHLNLATCYVNLRRWDEAVAALRPIHLRLSGDLGIRDRFREVCRTGFEAMRGEAAWLAEQGFDAQARLRMKEAVELLALQTAGAPAGFAKADHDIGTIAIIADTGLPQCRFYRLDQKLAQFKLLGITAQLFDFRESLDGFHQVLPSLQAVIFYRVPATPDIVGAIEAVRRAELPSFYEIDDLMFDEECFPDSFESYGGQISRGLFATLVTGTEALRGAMALCDYALASTEPLAERMARVVRSGQAFVHRNALHSPHEKMMAAMPARRDDGHIHIFYGTGTRAHNGDFEQHLTPALARILAEFPPVRLVVVGYLTLPPALAPFADQIVLLPPVWEIEAYWRILAGMDINLAVLKPGPVADCKSEIKWLEAAMLGIPSIMTPTRTYRDVVTEGETGLFATMPEDWYRAMRRLVVSQKERRRIGTAARDAARDAYAMPVMARNLRSILKSVTEAPVVRSIRKRVLIVNVFFPPQAVGGATRVVSENVLDLHRLYGDQLEIEVFTAIEGSRQPYRLSTYVWNGIRVTGVTTADDANIDMRVSDEKMGAAFSSCLDRFSPDIIHFHCIQRLTLTVCEVAKERGIPYYVTVHDGWWISDTQFLIDSCGALDLYDYAEPMAALARRGANRFIRMTHCAETLSGAARVLAVSNQFAELYERCGVRNVAVTENGLPSVVMRARSRSPNGKVRLAHVGGVSLHKGYNVFKAAVMLSRFENLEILIVDHALQRGIEHRSTWGTTPVCARGKVPQAEVADLYRDIDVLIAPSVWPESYGLVVREALQAGCWVVTSDRGALAQDIDAGCGHVVSVDAYQDLQEVLRTIDANAERYLRPIETPPVLRAGKDQAVELAAIYLGTDVPRARTTPPVIAAPAMRLRASSVLTAEA